jgi:flagellar FliJ protein
MAFKFSLATVLRYREELEKREERTLEQRREEVAVLEARLAEIRRLRDAILQHREAAMKRGTLGSDLHYTAQKKRDLDRMEQETREQLKLALSEFDKQMKAFLAARQKREILSELKSTQKDVYEEKQEKREQALVDELFGSRMQRDT